MIVIIDDGGAIDDLAAAIMDIANSFGRAFDTIDLALSIIGALLFRKIMAGQTLVRLFKLPLPFHNRIQARCRSPTKLAIYFSQLKRHRHAVITTNTKRSLL